MQFGKVDDPGSVDFTLPPDHPDTQKLLAQQKNKKPFQAYVGCAKWNKTDLKNFYPKGTKDELAYYSTQFNSIELNATFYNAPSRDQVIAWKQKTPDGFKFFPKLSNTISHFKRLNEVKSVTDEFCNAVAAFEEKLGMVFLQLHDNFKPKDFVRVEKFISEFPAGIPLGIEVRNAEWITNKADAQRLYTLLEENKKTNIIVDTAGRRDMLHMRLTSPTAFIRYVGANHESDYARLDDWLVRIKAWQRLGLQELYFFVHQNIEKESPLLSAYFIEKLNKQLGLDLFVPGKK
jgi:uncharacterized protein YecE (DUF72 family)